MKTTEDFSRKELISMIAMLRGELNAIVHVDEELDEQRLEELQLMLDATTMDVSESDLEEGGFAKKWFDDFLEDYNK